MISMLVQNVDSDVKEVFTLMDFQIDGKFVNIYDFQIEKGLSYCLRSVDRSVVFLGKYVLRCNELQ